MTDDFDALVAAHQQRETDRICKVQGADSDLRQLLLNQVRRLLVEHDTYLEDRLFLIETGLSRSPRTDSLVPYVHSLNKPAHRQAVRAMGISLEGLLAAVHSSDGVLDNLTNGQLLEVHSRLVLALRSALLPDIYS